MRYHIKSTLPTPQQWMELRASVGWPLYDEHIARQSLAHTPFCTCAFAGDTLVGMGRVLGDGVLVFYIGNVMVAPQWQGQGIGKAIMHELMRYVEENAAPGAVASLLSVKEREEFYTQFGFRLRPDDTRGSGMSRYF